MSRVKLAAALASMEEALSSAGRVKDENDDMREAARQMERNAGDSFDAADDIVTEIDGSIAILNDVIKDMGDDVSVEDISAMVDAQYLEIDTALDALASCRKKLERFAILHELDVSWREPVLPSEAPDAG